MKQEDYVIKDVHARQILDSRGTPTVEVDVTLKNGIMGRASVPSGASTGSFEAIELRDNDSNYYGGKSVMKAVNNVNTLINKQLKGISCLDQEIIDDEMQKIDLTKNKSNLGANAFLGVSLAVAKARALYNKKWLYEELGSVKSNLLPMPMMNVLNGGKHASSNLNIQEFMIMPMSAKNYSLGLEMCVNVYKSLKKLLTEKGLSTAVGDEGGFAPNLKNDEEALKLLVKAVENAGYENGKDFKFALDVASTEMYEEAKKIGKEGCYYFWKTDKLYTQNQLIAYYEKLVDKYPIFSIEDGLSEEDWDGWAKLTDKLGKKIQLVGDDLFVTNIDRLEKGIKMGCANSILIKVNQIGSLTETMQAIEMAKKAGFTTIISHRSGETEDTTISHLAVAVNAGQIKTGAPCRTDRVCKYNELLRIEENLGRKAKFGLK